MLKVKIKKEVFDALPDEVKEHYKEEKGEYVLETEGGEDVGALKRAKDRIQQDLADAKEELRTLKQNTNVEDVVKLQKQYDTQLAEATAASAKRIEVLENQISKGMIEGTAKDIANALTKHTSLLMPHIKSRLSVEFKDGEPKLVIKDAEGKASEMGAADLQKEFYENKEFSAIITASNANGGAGRKDVKTPNEAGGNGGSRNNDAPRLADSKPADLVAHIKASRGSDQ